MQMPIRMRKDPRVCESAGEGTPVVVAGGAHGAPFTHTGFAKPIDDMESQAKLQLNWRGVHRALHRHPGRTAPTHHGGPIELMGPNDALRQP